MKMPKFLMSLAALIVMFATLTTAAEAHVKLDPQVSEPGSFQQYNVRVPVERDSQTTKVELEVPQGVTVSAIQPVPGFKHQQEKNKAGEITKITWTATGEGIGENEYQNFPIMVANPDKEGTFKWNALQTYKDGKVVKWTQEGEDSENPAPLTELKTGGAAANSGEAGATTAAVSPWLWVISIAALIVAIVALFKRRNFTKSDK
ncbi:YcnI family copper-binding membrane protein [Staphylococcus delphini]|uniref:Nuclear export factor GLE1 n=1 Tax=Staphylococcus delphini TaxID=53344 RepID=A0A2A4H039_9STAP|nr:YcnI family protein [Staphylococcus delphini]MBZ8174376.1 YcnI family protein [Staphylococcus delphini]PCF56532.1 nuclear export factor GLE1 [Staphylococcus delphini]PCF63446.1 nuclear export factor GLE1 [Staphylococcus delphini]PCF73391.1 nuclear export factor GLE1 [Staphylococcus delphini]HEC2157236.1 YcnI family protein [Staphylococcus delphini]